MGNFGETLRAEREQRGLSLDDVARSVDLDRNRLLALERNELAAMPDDTEMAAPMRAYAECLGVDAELMFDDYRQEREACLRQLEAAVPASVVEARPAPAPHGVRRRSSLSPRAIAVVALAALAILAGWWIFGGSGEVPADMPAAAPTDAPSRLASPPASRPTSPPRSPTSRSPSRSPEGATDTPGANATAGALDPSDAPGPIVEQVPTPKPKPTVQPKASAEARPTPARLAVEASGVGSGVHDRQLVGQAATFAVGDQVWFWNRVVGGASGDRLEHVWLHDGEVRARIALTIGGPRWRTQSAKRMHPGSAGSWTVEARDAAGRVLARAEFDCRP